MSRRKKLALPTEKKGNPRLALTVGIINGHNFGRLQFRVQAADGDEYQRLKHFLEDRRKARDSDLFKSLEGSRDKAETLRIAWERHKRGETPTLTLLTGSVIDALRECLRTTPTRVNGLPLLRRSIESYRKAIDALAKFDRGRAVPEIASVLFEYRKHCEAHGQNFPFNRARTLCLWFAQKQHVDGIHSALYLSVAKVPPMHQTRQNEMQATIYPQTVVLIQEKMREQGNGHLAHHVMNLALMAVRDAEYTELPEIMTLHPEHQAALIMGTKTKASRRFIPMFDQITFQPNMLVERTGRKSKGKGVKDDNPTGHSTYRYRQFSDAFTPAVKALGETYTVHDLRGSGRLWMEMAGIDDDAADRLFGHSNAILRKRYKSLGDKPKWEHWKPHVDEARTKMAKWLNDQLSDEAIEPVVRGEGTVQVTLVPDPFNPEILRPQRSL